jgi:hypothetical protein
MMKKLPRFNALLPGATILLMASCHSSEPQSEPFAGDRPGSTDTSADAAPAGSGFGGDAGSTGPSTGNQCAAVSAVAIPTIRPADIIFAVDTSPSMAQEIVWVKAQMNTLSTLLSGGGIDPRVVLISDTSICIPSPLGSGQCNAEQSESPNLDEKLPKFRHVSKHVDSSDSLEIIHSTFAQWSASMRPEAAKVFVVISDDDSYWDATNFDYHITKLPGFGAYKFNAIVALQPASVCPAGAAVGTKYIDLVSRTGGVKGDLCLQNFAPVFEDIAKNVISTALACDFAVPPPPDGQAIDFAKVNVQFTPGGSPPPVEYLNIPGGSAACGSRDGWYYDDPQKPSKIILCPTSCGSVRTNPHGKIDVLFGCATKVPS